jgi:hypothetical protein
MDLLLLFFRGAAIYREGRGIPRRDGENVSKDRSEDLSRTDLKIYPYILQKGAYL